MWYIDVRKQYRFADRLKLGGLNPWSPLRIVTQRPRPFHIPNMHLQFNDRSDRNTPYVTHFPILSNVGIPGSSMRHTGWYGTAHWAHRRSTWVDLGRCGRPTPEDSHRSCTFKGVSWLDYPTLPAYPYTPWDCHICLHWALWHHPNVGIYGIHGVSGIGFRSGHCLPL